MRDGVQAALITVLWLAWLAYWIIAARGAKPLQRQEAIGSRLTHVVPLVIGAIFLASARTIGGWVGVRFLPRSEAIYWAGVIMLTAGIAFMIWARWHLGGNWSGRVAIKQGHELIRTGPYAIVRHPIYSGLLLALLGTVIAFGRWSGLIAFVFFAVAIWRKSRLEERCLAQVFADDYAQYRVQVPALLPSLVHRRGRSTSDSELP